MWVLLFAVLCQGSTFLRSVSDLVFGLVWPWTSDPPLPLLVLRLEPRVWTNRKWTLPLTYIPSSPPELILEGFQSCPFNTTLTESKNSALCDTLYYETEEIIQNKREMVCGKTGEKPVRKTAALVSEGESGYTPCLHLHSCGGHSGRWDVIFLSLFFIHISVAFLNFWDLRLFSQFKNYLPIYFPLSCCLCFLLFRFVFLFFSLRREEGVLCTKDWLAAFANDGRVFSRTVVMVKWHSWWL